jgi:Cof subfamily protein (haloacid dehalogenase superfamily)
VSSVTQVRVEASGPVRRVGDQIARLTGPAEARVGVAYRKQVRKPGLVACDVDGTLLPGTPVPTDRTRAAVGRVLADGTPFVLVTGRPPRWIPPIARHLPGLAHAVCANGAVRYDVAADQVLWSRTLSPATLRRLAEAASAALPGSWLIVERAGQHAFDEVAVPRTEVSVPAGWSFDYITEPRERLLAEPAIKLLVRHESMSSERMLAALRPAATAVDVALTFSNPDGLLEAAPAGVTKATGLADVAAGLGVARDEVIAFGDMPNDLEMLRWAGHGVAMGNGHREARAVADEVTAPNTEDGVALVLERWF